MEEEMGGIGGKEGGRERSEKREGREREERGVGKGREESGSPHLSDRGCAPELHYA